jgi:hypothetical protein
MSRVLWVVMAIPSIYGETTMSMSAFTIAARVLAKPRQDIYSAGKDKFSEQLSRWQGARAKKNLDS